VVGGARPSGMKESPAEPVAVRGVKLDVDEITLDLIELFRKPVVR
jgi:hypothetical protein